MIEHWGISLINRRMPVQEEPPDYRKLMEFPALELPGMMLGKLELTTALRKNKFKLLSFSRLLDSTLTRQAAEIEHKLYYDFQAHFSLQLKYAIELHGAYAGADFDLVRAIKDLEYQEKLRRLLRQLWAGNIGEKIKILLPLRWPPAGCELNAAEIAETMGNFMIPDLAMALELHIHEGKFQGAELELLDKLKYQIKVVRLIYEPELGNSINLQFIQPLTSALERHHLPVTLFFAPVCAQLETMAHELELLLGFKGKILTRVVE